MKYLILFQFIVGTAFAHDSVNGNNNNVNVCKPNVIVKSCDTCKTKPQVVTKVVEKVVTKEVEKPVTVIQTVEKDVSKKNRISLLLGYGAKGNLKESANEVVTENGAVLGAQYSRELNKNTHGLIQIQTNRTLSIGVGLGF